MKVAGATETIHNLGNGKLGKNRLRLPLDLTIAR